MGSLIRVPLIIMLVLFSGILLASAEDDKPLVPHPITVADAGPENIKMKALFKKRILFGHQSVGFDILDGIEDLKNQNTAVQLNVYDLEKNQGGAANGLIHFRVGRNTNPSLKIKHFEEVVSRQMAGPVDIAFFKLCWVDITPDTDIREVFQQYTSTIKRLRKNNPETQFVHMTVPLTSNGEGFQKALKKAKDFLKILLRKTNYYENSARNQYNELLRNHYRGKEPLFDLAGYQSGAIGIANQIEPLKQSLLPYFTEDGGHLNQLSRKMIAEQLLIFLSQL